MKKIEVEKIHYWSALVGQLGRSKNSRSHFKNILCCSFPNVTPITNITQIGWEMQKFTLIFEIRETRFQKSVKLKLLELEGFAWSHRIRKYLFYFEYKFCPRAQAAPEGPQLPQTSPKKNGKPSIFQMAQKIWLITHLFRHKVCNSFLTG